MRRLLAFLAVAAMSLAAIGCSGNERAPNFVAAMDARRDDGPASSSVRADSYYLEYESVQNGKRGTVGVAKLNDDWLSTLANPRKYGWIESDGQTYFCFESGSDFADGHSSACYAQDGYEAHEKEVRDFYFADGAGSTARQMIADDDLNVGDAPDRTIAGIETHCLVAAAGNLGTYCYARDSGLLVYMEGEFDGLPHTLTLKKARDAQARDFRLPYPLVEYQQAAAR